MLEALGFFVVCQSAFENNRYKTVFWQPFIRKESSGWSLITSSLTNGFSLSESKFKKREI
ncbi:hypothetical protein SDD27957_10300 [Streptococcus dysgalactiae subsp. dysgalactiae ATCC 27957]|nr:hypothetical protein SDD27957_10300 [Streptococcus dysgalactiae subsp. dysgalactiae ATCC 27957]